MSVNGKPTKILVVDDDPSTVRLLEKKLKETHGYDVITALDSKTAWNKARTQAPDLIVLDVMIPDMSGGRLAKILQTHPKTKHIPIVFITVLLEEKGKKRIEINKKFFRAISKPLYMPELLSAIRKTLNEKLSGVAKDPLLDEGDVPPA